MIELDKSVIDANLSHLAQPPTHARITDLRRSIRSMSQNESRDFLAVFGKRRIEAVYEYGSIVSGKFVANQYTKPVHCIVSLKDRSKMTQHPPPVIRSSDSDAVKASKTKQAADMAAHYDREQKLGEFCSNLLNSGVVPSPDSPWIAKPMPGTKAEQFQNVDLDALFASVIGEPRVKGIIVPDLPMAYT